MPEQSTNEAIKQSEAMQRYYAWQSKIYDATRWTFLFGRNQIIKLIPVDTEADITILEIGCGTGYNLARLAKRFPNARLIGLDASSHMIDKSRENTSAYKDRIELHNRPYTFGEQEYNKQIDVVLFSYSLTMINPQWKELILQAKEDLKAGGVIAVADFYNSQFQWFKNHMGNHHVRMDSHLNPLLKSAFREETEKIRSAYAGVWQYFMFVGRKE
jgi:S-adenosylmethionine-diacylgycerolhomoserine-N-methlytransferase